MQVYTDAERAGSTLVNFAVDDLEDHIEQLKRRGLEPGEITDANKGYGCQRSPIPTTIRSGSSAAFGCGTERGNSSPPNPPGGLQVHLSCGARPWTVGASGGSATSCRCSRSKGPPGACRQTVGQRGLAELRPPVVRSTLVDLELGRRVTGAHNVHRARGAAGKETRWRPRCGSCRRCGGHWSH